MKRLISTIILIQLTFLNADNYSLSFDGVDDYVLTPVSYTDLYGAETVSISASINWLSSDSDGGTSSQGIINNASSGSGMGHQIALNIDTGIGGTGTGYNKLSIWWEDESDFGNPAMEFAVLDTITEFENLTENLFHNLFLSITISFPISEYGVLAVYP